MPINFDEEPYRTIAEEQYRTLFPLDRGLHKLGKYLHSDSGIFRGWWYQELHDKRWGDSKSYPLEQELSKPKLVKVFYLAMAIGVPVGLISLAPQHYTPSNIKKDGFIFLLFLLAFASFMAYLGLRKPLVLKFSSDGLQSNDSKPIAWQKIENILFVNAYDRAPYLILILKNKSFKKYDVTDFNLNKLRYHLLYWWK